MNLEELRKKHKKDILAITDKYGVTNVRVFGSVVRGEATKNSDLDLLATYPEKLSLMDLVGMEYEIQDEIGMPVEVISDEAINKFMKERIMSDAKPL